MTEPDLTDPSTLPSQLAEQLTWHWEGHLRPRLDGLEDAEYLWEPVPGWNVRRRGEPSTAVEAIQVGAGDFAIDFAIPEPDPAPVTTIAWRLGHIIVGVLGQRVHSHFGGPAMDYDSFRYAGTAADALAQLDDVYTAWVAGVRALTLDQLWTPTGPAEPYPDFPFITLVLHIHREVIHHGAEICLLRDLYARQSDTP